MPQSFHRCLDCGTPNPRAPYLTKCLGCGRALPPDLGPAPIPAKVTAPTRSRGPMARALAFGLMVMMAVTAIRTGSLTWWAVFVLVFMPRWLFLVPLAAMGVGAIRSRRRLVGLVLAADALLVIGPLMGFSVPWGRLISSPPSGPMVRIMTFNRGASSLDVPRLARYLERQKVDVICFQEPGKGRDIDSWLLEHGWNLDRAGRVASRFPIVEDLGRSTDVNKSDFRYTMTFFRARLRHPDGFDFLVGSAHMPTPRYGLNRLGKGDVTAFRLNLAWWDEEAARLFALIADAGDTPILVGGDFNMPADYGSMASNRAGFPTAFEEAGWGWGYTRPTALPWVRIDHALASRDWTFARAWVGPDFGSDHLPLVAEAVLTSPRPAP